VIIKSLKVWVTPPESGEVPIVMVVLETITQDSPRKPLPGRTWRITFTRSDFPRPVHGNKPCHLGGAFLC
jgi:hypothetical protein